MISRVIQTSRKPHTVVLYCVIYVVLSATPPGKCSAGAVIQTMEGSSLHKTKTMRMAATVRQNTAEDGGSSVVSVVALHAL